MDFLEAASPETAKSLNESGGKTGAIDGSNAFKSKWKELSSKDDKFGDLQHAFIKKTHYDPMVKKISNDTGMDIGKRSKALQDVIWSTSVQHGSSSSVIKKALKSANKKIG